MERKVWTFFYGSFMNPSVLGRADVIPTHAQRGRLDGWDICIDPLVSTWLAVEWKYPSRQVFRVVHGLE